jgi:hypothetical protein
VLLLGCLVPFNRKVGTSRACADCGHRWPV